jgi:hypothetical protein
MKLSYFVALLVALFCCPNAQSQDQTTFPSKDEIKLFVTQTDRAIMDLESASKKYQGRWKATPISRQTIV